MRIGFHSVVVVATSGGCIGAVVAAGACLVMPPADVAPSRVHRPTILHASADPPADLLLREWPGTPGFNVPVQFDDPTNDVFVWDVFVDQVLKRVGQ
jgi:hypothetical protein